MNTTGAIDVFSAAGDIYRSSSEADYFTLEELQEIKSQIELYGVDLAHFKNRELLTLEICKDISHFNGKAWLSDDIQAGWFF